VTSLLSSPKITSWRMRISRAWKKNLTELSFPWH
jgi:hypothetical protein